MVNKFNKGLKSNSPLCSGKTNVEQWVLYSFAENVNLKFIIERFIPIIGSCTKKIESFLEFKNSSSGLVFIGHGNENGVYKPEFFENGLCEDFFDAETIGKCNSSPQVWWACHSSKWMSHNTRSWLGFESYIGINIRKSETKIWQSFLDEFILHSLRTLLKMNTEDNFSNKINAFKKRFHHLHFKKRKISYGSYICLLSHLKNIHIQPN